MRITKYVHSCLLVETPERVGIIDPGEFSWESGLFDITTLQRLDDIIVTHEHQDHMSIPFIQALIAKFPAASIITTESAAGQLRAAGFMQAAHQANQAVEFMVADHESLQPLVPAPIQNIGVHYVGQITHPGDSHHFAESKRILALPMTGPWGTIPRAAELGAELKPEVIIPIHDWHYNDQARATFYSRLEAFFAERGIRFVKPENGTPIEL